MNKDFFQEHPSGDRMQDDLFNPILTPNTTRLVEALSSLRDVTKPSLEDMAFGVVGITDAPAYIESMRRELDRIEQAWKS
jgi:hypothetical protein